MSLRVETPVTFLCLPCAGASASPMLAWRRLLPPWIDVRPIELPGRGARLGEPLVDDFTRLVERLAQEHADALRGPHALFGHSMGALLALGLARHAQRHGHAEPRALFACASTAPSRRDPDRFASLACDDDALTTELRSQGGTPDEILANPELRRLTLDTLRADFKVCASFAAPAGRSTMPVHVFGGRSDRIPPADLEAWRAETTGSFSLDWFDGNHFFIRQQAASVLALIAHRLGAVVMPQTLEPEELSR